MVDEGVDDVGGRHGVHEREAEVMEEDMRQWRALAFSTRRCGRWGVEVRGKKRKREN